MNSPQNFSLILKYYLLLRCLIVLGLAAGIAIISTIFNLRPPLLPCLIIVAILAAATWLTTLRKTSDELKQRSDLLWNLLVDVAALFLFAYFTGGATNPFITLFALPVIFAAATLPMRGSAVIAFAAIAAYTITMFVSAPFDPDRMQINVADEYLWGNWYTFVLIVGGIAALVARLAGNIRQRDRELASARQDALQADRVIALGSLASRAAEDLSTPLGTIAILGRDLENEAPDAATRQRLATLNQAVAECRGILEDLAADAGQQKSGKGHAVGADSYLAELVAKWGARNPDLNPSLQQNGTQPAPEILTDNVLDQAVLTLLDNAVQPAGARSPILTGSWNTEKLKIALRMDATDSTPRDAGAGTMNSNLFLAIATLKRLGAEISFPNQGRDGNAVELAIPLSAIRTS